MAAMLFGRPKSASDSLFFKSWTCGFKHMFTCVKFCFWVLFCMPTFPHFCLSAYRINYPLPLLCSSAFPHFHISAYVSEFVYFRAAACLHAYICVCFCTCVSASSHPCCCSQNFADVRRCSQILVDSCSSFMDFRRCS